jgi:hypothetical protein
MEMMGACTALHAYVRIMYILNNSEPTELIFLQSCRLIPNPPDIQGRRTWESRVGATDSARV